MSLPFGALWPMKRAQDGSGSDSGDEESASSDNETMALVKAHKKESKAAKQRKVRGADGGTGGGDDDEPDEADEGNLFIFDKRDGVDGSRRVTGVDGEEGAFRHAAVARVALNLTYVRVSQTWRTTWKWTWA